MIYAVIGFLKAPPPAGDARFEAAVNDHLAPGFPRIINAGYLRGRDGERVGVLALIDVDTFEQAEGYLAESPFTELGLVEDAHVAVFDVEVGRLG